MKLNVTVTKMPNFRQLQSNVRFGVAKGLTATAIDAQDAVVDALKGTFTLRGRWYEKGNYFGIKIKPAKKTDLSAEVRTRADWLELHETGGVKRPAGSNIAIPTENVRRTKLQKIGKAQRPRNLKRSFVLKTKKGKILFQRLYKGKRSKALAKYILEPKATIKRDSTFFEPGRRAIDRHLDRNIRRGLTDAFRTMR